MRSFRATLAAAFLIVPGVAFAAAGEPSASQPVAPAAEADRPAMQDPAREALAQAPVAVPLPSSRPKTIRPAKLRVARAAASPSGRGCSGYWCGRQFVLIVGVAY